MVGLLRNLSRHLGAHSNEGSHHHAKAAGLWWRKQRKLADDRNHVLSLAHIVIIQTGLDLSLTYFGLIFGLNFCTKTCFKNSEKCFSALLCIPKARAL